MAPNKITNLGGVYSETTAVRHLLSYYGAVAEHNEEQISEAMLFGISGGIGFAYFNFEYEGYEPTLYIGTAQRYKTRFGQYMDNLYKRLGLESSVKMTKSAGQAESDLVSDVAHERPVLLHVDRGYLPYYAEETEYGDHALVVVGHDEKNGNFIIADQAKSLLSLEPSDLSDARASIASLSYRSRTLSRPEKPINLEKGIAEGLKQCCDNMLSPPNPKPNFGITGLQKWAEMINNSKNKKGWMKVFSPGINLYVGLQWTFKCLETLETGGGGMRSFFADFLDEAQAITGNSEYKPVAAMYRELAEMWKDLAYSALPDDVPLLKNTRELIARAEHQFLDKGMNAIDEINSIKLKQRELHDEAMTNFPLSKDQSLALLDSLHEKLQKIADMEEAAIMALKLAG